MIPNPIVKVLSTLSSHEVRHLLMGGQACVFYGAAEFSRDCDIVFLLEDLNLVRLQSALDELAAKHIAVPPFAPEFLERGHAVHFRCELAEARGIRIDVMAKLRGVDDFASLWNRRTTLVDDFGMQYEVLGIHDLVKAKKTQRDKDWPMIRRLVDAHYASHKHEATDDRVRFWLLESRTPANLIELVAHNRDLGFEMAKQRGLLGEAFAASETALGKLLLTEQQKEMADDESYWAPLKRELESLRRRPRRKPKHGGGE